MRWCACCQTLSSMNVCHIINPANLNNTFIIRFLKSELNPAERSIEAGSVCSGQSYWSGKNLFLVSVTGKNPPPAEYIWCFICEQTDARNSFFNMVHFPFDGFSCIIKLASHAEHWTAFRDTFLKRKLSRSLFGAQECLFISISDDWSNNLLDNQRDILQLLKNSELFLAVHFLTCHHDTHLFLFRFIMVATEQQRGSLRKEYLNAVSNSMCPFFMWVTELFYSKKAWCIFIAIMPMQQLHMQTEALVYLKIWNTENPFYFQFICRSESWHITSLHIPWDYLKRHIKHI